MACRLAWAFAAVASTCSDIKACQFEAFEQAGLARGDGTVSYSLAAAGTVTTTGSESDTATMRPNNVYAYYAGARKTSGYYAYSVCNSVGTAVKVRTKGTATNFGLKREGAVRCNTTVSSSSLGYFAERDYC